MGLTPAHVNRILKRFRDDDLVELCSRTLNISSPKRLKKIGQFKANYLHLDRTVANDPAVADRAGDLL
jgi:hypothetical protein